MAILKKPLNLLVLSGGGVGVTYGAGGFGGSIALSEISNGENYLEELKEKISDVSHFLKLGGSEIQQSELVKQYVLTLSGAKDFAKVLVGSLIIDMVDNVTSGSASAIQGTIKSKIDSVRVNSAPTADNKEEIYRLYGDEHKYKSYHALKKVRQIAIDEFTSYLPTVLSNSTDNLKGQNHGDDLIKNGLGLFYDQLLDDYVKYNKPLFLKRFVFHYSEDDIEDKVKKLLPSNSVPSDFQYPKKAGYLFPYLKSNSKWEKLKGESSNIDKTDPKEENTDEPNKGKIIVPLSQLDSPGSSSQFIVAILKLHESINDSSKNSSTQISSVNILEDSSTASSTIDEIKAFDKGVYFRDKYHVQVLVKDTTKDDTTDIKKHLIAAAKNTSDGDYKFDLASELKSWMEKHFERIFLSKWSDIKDKQTSLSTSLDALKDVATKLKDLLDACFIQDSLIVLRRNLLRDYASLIHQHRPVQLNGSSTTNPMLKFAGKFPSEPYKSEDKKLNEVPLVFADLEEAYLSERKKTTKETIYETKIYDKYKEFQSKVSNLVSTKTTQLTPKKEKTDKDNKTLYIFTSSSGSTTGQQHLLDVTNLFNNLWISMVHDGSAENYLFQKQMRAYADNNIIEKSTTGGNGGTDDAAIIKDMFKDMFKDKFLKTQNSFHKVLVRRFIISKAIDALKSSIDPSIYKKELFKNISDTLKNIKNSDLEDLVDKLATFYGDKGYDLTGEYTRNWMYELIAMKFLSDNDFSNFRKILKRKFSKGNSASFIFSKKYWKGDICTPDSSNINSALDLDIKKVFEFNNEFLGHKKSDLSGTTTSWSPSNCLTKDEFFDFAITKSTQDFSTLDLSDADVKAGFKGLVFSDKYSEVLPKDISEHLQRLPIWGKPETIVKSIKEARTEAALRDILKALKNTFPDINWSFTEHTHFINPHVDHRSKSTYGAQLTLDQRKNILIGFISQESDGLKSNSSLQEQFSKQTQWSKSSVTNSSNSFLKTKLNRQNGLFEYEKSKILEDGDGHRYLVHLVQVKYDDLHTKESWNDFTKNVGSDLIASEVVKLAKDKSLQKQAIYHLLNETESGKGIGKISVGDSRLRERLGISWITDSNS